jgi:histidinol-phosphate aminotransferase
MDVRFVSIDPITWDFDLESYLALVDEPDCKLAILCHPNNPTGHLLDEDKVRAVIEHTDKPVLVDETYFEFSGRTFRDELGRYPNLLIVRSFSKSFSGAGLRFGYLLSSPENIHELRKVICFFNTSLLVQAFALSVLDHTAAFAAHNREVVRLREEMLTALRDIPGVIVYASGTNFLTFTIGPSTKVLYAYLVGQGIALRDVGAHPVLQDHVRVTVSSPADNMLFLNALAAFLHK